MFVACVRLTSQSDTPKCCKHVGSLLAFPSLQTNILAPMGFEVMQNQAIKTHWFCIQSPAQISVTHARHVLTPVTEQKVSVACARHVLIPGAQAGGQATQGRGPICEPGCSRPCCGHWQCSATSAATGGSLPASCMYLCAFFLLHALVCLGVSRCMHLCALGCLAACMCVPWGFLLHALVCPGVPAGVPWGTSCQPSALPQSALAPSALPITCPLQHICISQRISC